MEFDPEAEDPAIGLRVRNLIDAPEDTPRGGSALETSASNTGRKPISKLSAFNTLANADVRLTTRDGRPIRATRSGSKGQVLPIGLADIDAGEIIIATAWNGTRAKSTVLTSKKA